MINELLTVEEVAVFLRTTPNTIYRWLRSGKLPGVKLGKEWRIRKEVLDAKLAETTPMLKRQSLLDGIELKSNHMMAISSNEDDLLDLEAEFFKKGLALKQRLFKGCWWQNTDDVRQELAARGVPIEELEKNNLLTIIDLAKKYETSGVQGPIQVWRDEATITNQLGYSFLWASGSPGLESCGNFSNLIRFESLLDDTLAKLNVVGICPYLYNDAGKNGLNEFIELMKCHRNVMFYNHDSFVYLKNNFADN
ncbi:MEDS domain-containing protein [Desulfosporosinus sp. PR]|uniref:MEDS domain-containing protein n=1 Tax=Candidatus Desulfosporosinus nitrosoreducens TaxID=3401928 RepID=UPI0027F0E3EA|nr:MEDS domain-containing protein [Desulfosporosinus sp. PR]MDQ7097103.1 MEDS domain-containing protein [Desulfosporosinus sp. PR]